MPDTLKLADVDRERSKRLAQRMHVKQDEITIVRKGYEVKAEEANDAERTIVARVSTADRDRDGEIVEPKGIELKDYRANPVLMWAHNYGQPAIGKALWSQTDDKGLVCKFQFAPTQFADEIYQLYKGGYQRAFSIGFIPVEFDQQTKTHKKISLLEVSAVPVPANQSALVMEAYAKGIVKSEKLMKDLEIDIAPDHEPPASAEFVQTEGKTITNVPDDEPFTAVNLAAVTEPEPPVAKYDISEEDAQYVLRWQEGRILRFDMTKWSRENVEVFARGWAAPVDPPVAKMFDTEQNPSITDIQCAVYMALNPNPAEGQPYASSAWVNDLYPVDYPNGHVVYGKQNEDGSFGMFLVDYTYEKDGVTLGEKPVPVVQAYARRRGGKGAGVTIQVIHTVDFAPFEKAIADLNALIARTEVVDVTDEPDPPALDIEPSPDIEIKIEPDPAITIDEASPDEKALNATLAMIDNYFKSGKFDEMVARKIGDRIDLAIDKARGVVR